MTLDATQLAAAETEKLSDLLGLIYDAALDPAVWPEALRQTSLYLGFRAGGISSFDLRRTASNFSYSFGYLPGFIERHADYWLSDPLSLQSFRMKIGDVASITDAMPLAEFYQSRMFTEWAEPQGLIDSAQICVDRTPLTMAVVGMARDASQGLVDAELKRNFALLAPHFRRAVLVGRAVDLAHVEAAAFADTLDGLTAGVFLVDGSGYLLHANVTARAMLAAGDIVSDTGGVLTARDGNAAHAILDAVAAAAGGDAAVAARGVSVPMRAADGQRYIGHVLPLGAGRRKRSVGSEGAMAALFIHSSSLDLPEPAASVAAQYRLTPSEARVLVLVLQLGGVPGAAAMLGVADATVRTHLRHIFDKTGTSSQVELARLVVGHASPLRAAG